MGQRAVAGTFYRLVMAMAVCLTTEALYKGHHRPGNRLTSSPGSRCIRAFVHTHMIAYVHVCSYSREQMYLCMSLRMHYCSRVIPKFLLLVCVGVRAREGIPNRFAMTKVKRPSLWT